MSAISSGLFPPSNRRRCVKGRTAYTEPSDNFIASASFNHDLSNDNFTQNDYSSMEPHEPDDVDEEPITIDLSAFLSENPLLTESAVENAAENNVASVESNSQFRVTDCEIKPSDINDIEVTKTTLLEELSTNNITDINNSVNSIPNENNISPLVLNNLPSDAYRTKENSPETKENCPGSNSSNIPLQNIIVNDAANNINLCDKKSPVKKYTKAKPLGLSNPLRKYKNFLKCKDFNKTNVKVFGKYPIVKCERLDIENFVKNNKIKVTNWPLHHTNKIQRNNKSILNKNSVTTKRINLTKTVRPKLLRKPVSFNKLVINSSKRSVNKVSSILVDSFDAIPKTVVIKTDCWNPEITKSSTPVSGFFKNPLNISAGTQKSIMCGVLKEDSSFSDNLAHIINYNIASSPEKKNFGNRKGPFITSVNKVCNSPKTYQFIAPKPTESQEIANITPNLPKPVIEPVSEPVLKDYTVIEPYVEDPTSPVKPKPILTVPVEIIQSPEKQNIVVHSNLSQKVESSGNKILNRVRSVFLNGAIKQISIPSRSVKEISVVKKEKKKFDRENISNNDAVFPAVVNKNGESSEDHLSSLKAKNVVVDAMQSAFTTVHKIKKPNPRIIKKTSFADVPKTGCSSFNSTLNDLLFGFAETDFNDSYLSTEDESFTQDTSSNILTSPTHTWSPEIDKECSDNEVSKHSNETKRKWQKRKKFASDSPNSSDTLSASECENGKDAVRKKSSSDTLSASECENEKVAARKKSSVRKKFRKHSRSSDTSETPVLASVCDALDKSEKLNFPEHSVNSINTKTVTENNKDFEIKPSDSSVLFSELENSIKNKHSTFDSPGKIKAEITSNPNKTSLNKVDLPLSIKTDNNNHPFKQTRTRSLRERKQININDKIFDNSIKQNSHNRDLQEKNSKLTKSSINSKLRVQMKTPPRSTAKVKIKSKSKDSDIIQEIETITNAPNGMSKGNLRVTRTNKKNSGRTSTDDVKDSESNISLALFKKNSSTRMRRKKRVSLKVRFKLRRKKKAPCLKMPLNSLTDVLQNADSTSSMSENNSLHSSFREGKGEKMGTPCKEENTCENDASISDSNMEIIEMEKNNVIEEQFLSSPHEDSMVNSSEISLNQDDRSINSDNKLSNLTADASVNSPSDKVLETDAVKGNELSNDTDGKSPKNVSENASGTLLDSNENSLARKLECNAEGKAPESVSESTNDTLLETDASSVARKLEYNAPESVNESISGMLLETDESSVIRNPESNIDNRNPTNENTTSEMYKEHFEDSLSASNQNAENNSIRPEPELEENKVAPCLIDANTDNIITQGAKSENSVSDISEHENTIFTDNSEPVKEKCKTTNVEETSKNILSIDNSVNELSSRKAVAIDKDNADIRDSSYIDTDSDGNLCTDLGNEDKTSVKQSSLTNLEQNVASETNLASKSTQESMSNNLKISAIESSDQDTPDSLKNWYISESNQVMNSVLTYHQEDESKNSSAQSVDDSNSRDVADLSNSRELKVDSNLSDSDKEPSSTDTSVCVTTVENKKNAAANTVTAEDATNAVTSSMLTSVSPITSVFSPNDALNETESDKNQLALKEEPMDYEEKEVSDNIGSNTKTALKGDQSSIPSPNNTVKKCRGRPRKSLNKHSEMSTEVKVECPANISDVTPTSRPRGRKLKVNPPVKTPTSSGRKKNYDPELVCVPFSMGWMREHVIRATEGKHNKRLSDIYYFAPDGTKLRSMPEISSYLGRHTEIKLSLSNFTFAKELVYRLPFEVERDAKTPGRKPCTPATSKKGSFSKTSTSSKQKINSTDVNIKQETNSSSLSADSKQTSLSENVSPVQNTKGISDKKNSKRKNVEPLKIKTSTPVKKEASDSETPKGILQKRKRGSNSLNESESCNLEKTDGRPTRNITKRVPYDNSYENISPRKQRLVVQRNTVSGNITISNLRSIKEKTENKLSDSSSVVTDNVSEPSCMSNEKVSQLTGVTKESNLSANKHSSDITGYISEVSTPGRTSVKSSVIQNRLKVKFAPRKSDVLHRPCTKYCNFSNFLVPSVKCSICLCLFHPECIPFKPYGETKYACVPCVKTQINRFGNESEPIFPRNLDIELLYPSIDLQIKMDINFDSTFNKFFAPVDESFAYLQEDFSANQQMHHLWHTQLPSSAILNTVETSSLSTSYDNSNKVEKLVLPPNFNVKIIDTHKEQQATLPSSVGVSNPASCQQLGKNLPLSQNVNIHLPVQNTVLKFPYVVVNSQSENVTNNISAAKSTSSICQDESRTLATSSNVRFTYSKRNNPVEIPSSSFTQLQHPAYRFQSGSEKPLVSQQNTRSLISQNIRCPSGMPRQEYKASLPCKKNFAAQDLITVLMPVNMHRTVQNSGNIPRVPHTFNELYRPYQTSTAVPDQSSSHLNCPPSFSAIFGNLPTVLEGNKRSNSDDSNRHNKKLNLLDNLPSSETIVQVGSSTDVVRQRSQLTECHSSCWDISTFSKVYECLNLIFKFLNVYDLLRASLVCRSWKHLATQKFLWESVSFSGLNVTDWDKCCLALQRYGTRVIDFQGILDQDSVKSWKFFAKNINRLTEAEELIFEKVPPFIINTIADCLPQLKKLTCYCLTSVFTEPEIWSTPCEFELATLRYLGRLQRLKISSMGGILLNSQPQSLYPYLPKLTHLVLTGFKFHSYYNLECLSQQQQLVSLELGDCDAIEPQIYGMLAKLTNLKRLCLQNGGIMGDTKLPEAVSKMNELETLELMNFKVSVHLSDVTKNMKHLCHLSIWPDNRSEAALINFNSFSVVTSCKNLKSICWGILAEDDMVPDVLELKDPSKTEKEPDKLTLQELFQTLVKHFPGKNVDVKCLPRSIWSEFCSSRQFT